MKQKDLTTEQKIFDAARDEFIEKGLDGTRMQEIADRANINKSLLHYYYRTKELLFDAVFKFAFKNFVPSIEKVIQSDAPLYDKLQIISDQYITLLMKNPFVPQFVLHEINRNPQRLYNLFTEMGIKPKMIMEEIKKALEKENLKPIDPRNLIMNLLSLCIFPLAAKPLLMKILFEEDQKAYKQFMEGRKREVPDFIYDSLKK